MAFDSVPWLVEGGAVHSGAVARTLPYAAFGGAEGVVESLDLKVSASPSPDGRVRAGAGACGINNTYPGQTGQAYVGRNTADEYVNIAPTAGAGRSDMIVARIDDPQYGGTTPADPAVGPYIKLAVISNVGSTATDVPGSVTYPAIPLARIDIPASTSTITSGMIVDLRKLIKPRNQHRLVHVAVPASNILDVTTPATPGKEWPIAGGINVNVPSWATKMTVLMMINGIYTSGSQTSDVWIRKGLDADPNAQTGPAVRFDTNVASVRNPLYTSAEFDILPSERGTLKNFSGRGLLLTGSGAARPAADDRTDVIFDIWFTEEPASA